MQAGDLITILLSLIAIGLGIVGALIRIIFAGMRSRIDKIEEKLDRCMEEMIKLARNGRA